MIYIIISIISFTVIFILNYRELYNKKIKKRDAIIICFIFTISFITGCKVLNIFLNLFRNNIYILSGFMFNGGIILSIIAICTYCKIKNIDLIAILTIIIPNIILLYSILKIGCLFSGCCIGIYNFPIQFFDSFFSICIYHYIKEKYKGINIIYMSSIMFGSIRFFSILLRDEMDIINFIVNELINITIILIGLRNINLKKFKKD